MYYSEVVGSLTHAEGHSPCCICALAVGAGKSALASLLCSFPELCMREQLRLLHVRSSGSIAISETQGLALLFVNGLLIHFELKPSPLKLGKSPATVYDIDMSDLHLVRHIRFTPHAN